MDNDFTGDIDDIIATLRTHDVVIARFITLHRRLLFDFRSTPLDPPLVQVVDPVPSVEARCRYLRRVRPRLEAPTSIVSVSWPRFAASFAATDAWAAARARIAAAPHPGALAAADAALAELVALERACQHEAIRGSRAFRTLWSASPSPR